MAAHSASIPPASGNKTTTFLGEPPFPHVQSMSFPGVDFVVISKDGHVTMWPIRASPIFLASGSEMDLRLEPDKKAQFLTLGKPSSSFDTRD